MASEARRLLKTEVIKRQGDTAYITYDAKSRFTQGRELAHDIFAEIYRCE